MNQVITPVNIESRKNLDMRPGDTVRVYQKIQEKDKTRIQVFEGLVLSRKHGAEPGATFTVRRSTGGYGVEKIYPLFSPMIDKIEVVKRSKVRRSKLYYIREKALKQISKRMKMMFVDHSTETSAPVEEAAPVVAEDSADNTAESTEEPKTADENVVVDEVSSTEEVSAPAESTEVSEEKKEA